MTTLLDPKLLGIVFVDSKDLRVSHAICRVSVKYIITRISCSFNDIEIQMRDPEFQSRE